MSGSVVASNKSQALADTSLEISVLGKWIKVPALEFSGDSLVVHGKLVKIAIVHDEEWLDHELKNPELCVERLKDYRSHRLRADILTFSQIPPHTDPKFPYHVERESVAVIQLASFTSWWESLPQEARKNVRRAGKRGVRIAVKGLDDDLVKGIVGLNNETPVKQGRPNAHYGKSFDQVKKDQSAFPDRSDFICAYFGEELIGHLKIVYRGETASILQLTPSPGHQDKRPANAMLSKAVEICAEKGIRCITYGKFNYGTRSNSSLLEFKVRNGFEELLMPRYYVPLTSWGRISMCLNLHHGIQGIFPKFALAAAINLRAKWYNKNVKPV